MIFFFITLSFSGANDPVFKHPAVQSVAIDFYTYRPGIF